MNQACMNWVLYFVGEWAIRIFISNLFNDCNNTDSLRKCCASWFNFPFENILPIIRPSAQGCDYKLLGFVLQNILLQHSLPPIWYRWCGNPGVWHECLKCNTWQQIFSCALSFSSQKSMNFSKLTLSRDYDEMSTLHTFCLYVIEGIIQHVSSSFSQASMTVSGQAVLQPTNLSLKQHYQGSYFRRKITPSVC